MTGFVLEMLDRYGLVAVFGAVWLECMGIPVPAETALVVFAAYAAHEHTVAPVLIFLVAALAAIMGDNAGYGIGRWGGWPLLRRWGHLVRLDEPRLKVARYVFARHGGPVVMLGRFVALLRTTAAFLAGVNHMPWRRFLAFNAVGGLAWAAVWTTIGYVVGDRVDLHGGPLAWAVPGAFVGGVVIGTVLVRRRWGQLSTAAEAAYPGPL